MELPSVAAAGQADIVPVIITAHAATIHDISLRTHYTRGSHSEMARKLLIAPSHTGAGLGTIEGTPWLCQPDVDPPEYFDLAPPGSMRGGL